MRFAATIRIALRALKRNKLRTALTMLGMIIGVAAVIAMVSIGNGAKSQVEAQIASLGENVILIFSGSTSSSGVRSGWGGSGTLKIEDAEAIQREIAGVSAVSPEIRSSEQVAAGNQNWRPSLLGESPDYFDIRKWPFVEGSTFSDQDVRSSNKVCVIGQTTARQLFGNQSPLGEIIRVKGVPFTIVGLLAPKGMSVMGSDQDDVIVMPYTSAMKRVLGQTMLRAINVQADNAKDLPAVQQQIISLLRQRHRIGAGREDDFTVRSQEEIAAAATQTTTTLTLLVGAIAGVSLIVGGIGIMNIMLVSVTERTREIGIRMSVGAHGRDIMRQFLIEALTLSCLGGMLGIALGMGTSEIVSKAAGWPTQVDPNAVGLAFVISAAFGIFFGYYPTRKAAALDPIEALRYE
jgi:putative ABC transport system permease protein